MLDMRSAAVALAAAIIAASFVLAPVAEASEAEHGIQGTFVAPNPDPDAEIPDCFDLRDMGTVTPVRAQDDHGLCWSFASMAAIESLLMLDGGDGFLSPLYTAGLLFDSSGDRSPSGDRAWLKGDADSSGTGGNSRFASLLVTDWRGPVAEELDPFDASLIGQPSDPELSLWDAAHVTGTRMLYMDSDAEEVKRMLMTGLSGAVGIAADREAVMQLDGTSTINVPDGVPNHEVALVGWDDGYPREDFLDVPDSDGAWLVKNSWGSGEDDDGYLWVSYESSMDYVMFYTSYIDAGDGRLYSHDHGLTCFAGSDLPFEGSATAANVFTSRGDESLSSVSFTSFSMDDARYSVQVYTGITDPSDPTGGVPALDAPVTGVMDGRGSVWIPLGAEVALSEGEIFSVCVTFEAEHGYVPLDTYYEDSVMVLSPTASAGESFLLGEDGEWEDLGADGHTNIRIKAFTDGSWDVTPEGGWPDVRRGSGGGGMAAVNCAVAVTAIAAACVVLVIHRRR